MCGLMGTLGPKQHEGIKTVDVSKPRHKVHYLDKGFEGKWPGYRSWFHRDTRCSGV